MSGQKHEEYVPEPVVEFNSKSRVASWPITSLRALLSALSKMGYTVSNKNKELELLSKADIQFSRAISQLKQNSHHGNLEETKDTIDLIQEVEDAAHELRSAQEEADASRPKIIHTTSPSGRSYDLCLQSGSYIVNYEENEVFIDGKLDRVEKDQEARKFVNELTHSYCMADEEHKKIVSEEQVGLDNISIDLREKLKSARKIMDQWQKVREVSRIKKLIRERQDFFESESKKLGYKSKVFEMGDDIVIKIEDTGRKKIKIIEEEDREDSRLEGRN
tara:strand:+ start:1713 stop:2540 length:828 start_codon:yes stop_codon:yes gene_type:complete